MNPFRFASSPAKLEIISQLDVAKRLSVGELCSRMPKWSRSTIRTHLRDLAKAAYIRRDQRIDGSFYYLSTGRSLRSIQREELAVFLSIFFKDRPDTLVKKALACTKPGRSELLTIYECVCERLKTLDGDS
jgi:DNA-binding transcriptional ArsR family regulator